MSNKKSPKLPLKRERLFEAIKLRGTSIRKLGALDGGVGWSDKTIRRAVKEGEINPAILDALGKFLDVDPNYLSGKYDRLYERIGAENRDEYLENALKAQLRAERFPYQLSQHKGELYDRYLEGILVLHGISMRQFNELSFETQKQFEIDIERNVGPVIAKYFAYDARGRKGLSDLYQLEAEIECYDPDEPDET